MCVMCNVDGDCIRDSQNGTCYNNRCFRSCASDDECPMRRGPDGTCYEDRCYRSCTSDRNCRRRGPGGRGGRGGVCDTDNSRCVMCNVDADCERNPRGDTCEDNTCV